MKQRRLSFSVICGVLIVLQTIFTPVLPSVTPEFALEVPDGGVPANLIYDIIPSSQNSPHRVRRQVSIVNDDQSQAADKSALNKNPVSNTKKPIQEYSTKVTPTNQPVAVQSTNSNAVDQGIGGGQSLPPNSEGPHLDISGNTSQATDSDAGNAVEGSIVDGLIFDGNSTYLLDLNKTEHDPSVTLRTLENFKYYNVSYDTDGLSKYWVDMNHAKAKKHDMLSHAHRRAATVKAKFPILFYGHHLPNLTVATGGFIYLGDQVHAWLAATQYVAPLMANFDSSTSLNATVSYLSEDDFFTVEWNQVRLQDSPGVKPFTFQTTLFKNGTIIFVYKTIPIPVGAINDTNHPVKVGLSDAYIKDKNMLFVRQKTIYEYDRVDIKHHPKSNIVNGTAIIFVPATTCLQLKSCEACTFTEIQFKCSWCPATGRCSNGTDRFNQEWTQKGCDKQGGNLTTIGQCFRNSVERDSSSTYNVATDHGHDGDIHGIHGSDDKSSADSYIKKVKAPETEGMSATGVIGVMFLMMLIFGGVGWLAYAYFFPHSPSGQMLIRYRPSQWAFRRGEARYTAASIHM